MFGLLTYIFFDVSIFCCILYDMSKKNMLKTKFNYFFLFVFLLFSLFLTALIFSLSYFIANQNEDIEKVSPYECGFDPFEDARNQVDIHFYLVAILFIIFDIEAAYLYPWAVSMVNLDSSSLWVFVDFLVELAVGLLYAWKCGALDWE
jgi:NADH-quinone oxidoreductase subunit A